MSSLEEFKKELQNSIYYNSILYSDALLERFLRARSFNIPKAVQMFENAQAWRLEVGVDKIVKDFVFNEREQVAKIWPRFFHGIDRQGRPVIWNVHSKLDANELYSVTNDERMIFNFIREQEKLQNIRFSACSDLCRTEIDQVVLILDCKGYPYHQFHRIARVVHRITRISSDYYPESLGRIFIINAPLMFPTVWAVASKFFDEGTRSKISIFGSDYSSALTELIDPNNVPASYGGACYCLDGCEKSDKGPWNDKKWLKSHQVSSLYDFYSRDTMPSSNATLPAIQESDE